MQTGIHYAWSCLTFISIISDVTKVSRHTVGYSDEPCKVYNYHRHRYATRVHRRCELAVVEQADERFRLLGKPTTFYHKSFFFKGEGYQEESPDRCFPINDSMWFMRVTWTRAEPNIPGKPHFQREKHSYDDSSTQLFRTLAHVVFEHVCPVRVFVESHKVEIQMAFSDLSASLTDQISCR